MTTPADMQVSPTPDAEEMAAIAAAVEALWPRPVMIPPSDDAPSAWRVSGRGWMTTPLGAGRRAPRRPWWR